MNSEELEQSLRTEFEGYLKNILADVKQEVSQFQQKIDTELEKHKSHLDEVFQEFSERIQLDPNFDEGFRESVVEHLRLARDEGARITATAIAEAEELTKASKKEVETDEPSVKLSDIRDAINDISSQNSQSAILKALITHAAKFTPRGAFFVVKNQHFVGWRVFGKQEKAEDGSITEIIFSTSAATVLGESVRSLSVVESTYGAFADDADYLKQLDFGTPEKMYAVPLIARGRGVAAIYADQGNENDEVNVEALETLVSVAGLTVELLAAAQSSNYVREPVKSSSYAAVPATENTEEETSESVTEEVEEVQEVSAVEAQDEAVEEVQETSVPAYGFEAEEEAKADHTDSYEEYEETVEPMVSEEKADAETEVDYSEEVYADQASEVQEIEVEEPALNEHYQEPSESTVPVYEVSDDLESTEEEISYSETTDDEETEEDKVETTYSFSSESPSEEMAQTEYEVYDDDLIEEVQAKPEEEETESVYEETSAAEEEKEEAVWTQPEEIAKEEAEVEAEEQVEEPVAEYSFQTESAESADKYESSDEYESAVETEEEPEVYTTTPSISYAEFETNQDFNSAPVQFEETVETAETASFEYSEPEAEESPVVEEISYSEEVTYSVQVEEPQEVSDETSSMFGEVETVEEVKEEPEYEAPVETAPEPAVTAVPVRTRFSDRNVDLPIEVSEEERRLHNDARRFARLLVSEIKLYNEQKVKEGRDAHDLYERLREAIDRSREMYDKRVQPVVVDRFDYFHFEVVNTLAEGEESKLGTNYPGATV